MGFAGTWPKTGRVKKGKLKEEKIKIVDKTDAKKYAFCLNTLNNDILCYKNVNYFQISTIAVNSSIMNFIFCSLM